MAELNVNERIRHLIANDRMIPLFKMEVEEASGGHAKVSALVREEFLQAMGLAHGTFIFALIDVAFALAVNEKVDTVAAQWSISQFRSASLGEKVTAECHLLHGGRRLMVVEAEVFGREGKLLAKGQATGIPVGEGHRA